MAHMPRGKAITNYLRTAQEQLTYGVQYHRGITDKGSFYVILRIINYE